MVPFNRPPYIGKEMEYISKVIRAHKICGDGQFTKKCHQLLEQMTGSQKVLLTTSGSHALEMAALLCNLEPGDEVILPSFTFSSTANAFVLAGAKLVFVDIRPDTMNIDETKIEAAITDKTRVIVPVHYAGVACEMDTIMEIARKHNLKVVEDAAQGVRAGDVARLDAARQDVHDERDRDEPGHQAVGAQGSLDRERLILEPDEPCRGSRHADAQEAPHPRVQAAARKQGEGEGDDAAEEHEPEEGVGDAEEQGVGLGAEERRASHQRVDVA